MEEPESQATQPATQAVLDPRRVGKQNSGFSDEDVSDIICLLVPYSDPARQLVLQMAHDDSPHIISSEAAAGIVEPNYKLEDEASRFNLAPADGQHAIALRLSSQTKNPLMGFTFGRNLARCDVHFAYDPLRRLSNAHFRIYVNAYGLVMLEDQSTNGTIVDTEVVSAKAGPKRSKMMLQSGSRVSVLLSYNEEEIKFLVRIPHRAGQYDKAYTSKVKEYFARLELLEPDHIRTVGPDRTGPPDIFASPHRPAKHPARKVALPTSSDQGPLAREWDGAGKYNKVGTIGKGAFAVVYKVTSKFDGNPYAAKELDKKRFVKNGVLDQKIDNEMKIMQRVRHPNIVEYIEHFDWEDRLFIIIMEFVPGGDLGKLISDRGALPEELVQAMASQLLNALGYLHENNVTHRDVKPDNILIQSLDPFEVKLTDFGLSKMVDNEQTFLRTFCGTLLYCAPEVYSEYAEYDDRGMRHPRNRARRAAPGQRYDHAVDVWSLGGVFFYGLTASPPYPVRSGISYSELLHQIMTTPLNTAPLRIARVQPDGIDFLCQMLQRRPELRATVVDLEDHPWLGGPGTTMCLDEVPSFDDISEDDILGVDASQLSLQEGPRVRVDRNSQDDDDDERIEETDEDSEKENNTIGRQAPRLFGEVNVSAIGSSGVIPEERLNLPVSGNSFAETEILDTEAISEEIRDSYDSSESFTPRHAHQGGVATLSHSLVQSISGGQSADQLQSLVLNVASQSLGGSESVSDNISMASGDTSDMPPSHAGGDFNTSKRKPSPDTSNDFDETPTLGKPTFKRLKSENNIDAMADEVLDEYKLLAAVPPVERLKSGRQIDGPVNKTSFWEVNRKTWHLRYPEMTQLQYDAFARACRERGEDFAPGKTPLWELAMTYFPPSEGTSAQDDGELPSTARILDSDTDPITQLPRDEGKFPDRSAFASASSHTVNDTDSLPDTQQIIVPVVTISSPAKRALAIVESRSGSAVRDISVLITDTLVSYGRGPENTELHRDKMQVAIPKYAFKILLWKDGYDPSKDPSKTPHPWHRHTEDDKATGSDYAFYISTKARGGIFINNLRLESHDPTNPLGPSQRWVKLYDGDDIILCGFPGSNEREQARVIFKCFWGGSSQPRPESEPASVAPSTTAKKLDEACHRTERRIRNGLEHKRKMAEAEREFQDRQRLVERERRRSRAFELRRAEAIRVLSSRGTSRRGSPMSMPEVSRASPSARMSPGLGVGVGIASAPAVVLSSVKEGSMEN